jgi:CRP-like cAMP-binding protein
MSLQLASQLQVFVDRLDNLEYKKASERVAYSLLFLASRFGVRQGLKVRIAAPITHTLLADSINLARESVSRELKKLENDRFVIHKDHQFIIEDVDGLTQSLTQPVGMHNWSIFNTDELPA